MPRKMDPLLDSFGTLAPRAPSPLERLASELSRLAYGNDERAGTQNMLSLLGRSPDRTPEQGLADTLNPLSTIDALYNSGQELGRGNYLAGILGIGLATPGGRAMRLGERALEKRGIRAYHGSPHSFEKFSTDKIGAGEGAQAFGRGLYFAENEGVANSYRKSLTPPPETTYHGLPLTTDNFDYDTASAAASIGKFAKAYKTDFADAQRRLLARTTDKKMAKAIEGVDASKLANVDNPGHMYEVEINADPDAFLDYDAPGGPGLIPKTKEEADRLVQAGIPGVKYLDQGSRAAGSGTRNYVVFDDSIISIVRKYGIAAALAAGAISQTDAEALAAQGYQ